jgi:hypothetical protein
MKVKLAATIATSVRMKSRAGFNFLPRDPAVDQSGTDVTGVSVGMSDPRNVAHDKKVTQEKEHHPESHSDSKPRKGRGKKKAAVSDQNDAAASTPAPAESEKVEQAPGELEKSMAVLSKLKDMEFHSRANIEALAGLILTIEDELKQKEFSDPIGALYAAQDGFHTKIAALIESYGAKCESLKPLT